MTTFEFCDQTGISPQKLTCWNANGLLEAELVEGRGRGGFRRELTEEHVERVRILQALLGRRIPFRWLADRPDLTFGGARYLVFDGRHLEACQDAGQAIATVAKAKHRCAAVDLAAVRAAI
jgi:hypothetical protein